MITKMAIDWAINFETIDPRDVAAKTQGQPGFWEVGLPKNKVALLQSKGHIAKLARLKLIEGVLEAPIAIFGSWSRPNTGGCFVYVGRPKFDHLSMTVEVSAKPGFVFAIFVGEDGSIDEWTWRQSTIGDPDRPDSVEGQLLWPLANA